MIAIVEESRGEQAGRFGWLGAAYAWLLAVGFTAAGVAWVLDLVGLI